MNHLRTESEKLESYTEKTLQKFKDKYLVATSRFKAQMAEKDQEIDYLERKVRTPYWYTNGAFVGVGFSCAVCHVLHSSVWCRRCDAGVDLVRC